MAGNPAYKGKVYRLGIYEEIEDAIEAKKESKRKSNGRCSIS